MEVIKDMSTNYMKAQGLNQAYMLLKLRNNYYTYSVNMFIWIDNGIELWVANFDLEYYYPPPTP